MNKVNGNHEEKFKETERGFFLSKMLQRSNIPHQHRKWPGVASAAASSISEVPPNCRASCASAGGLMPTAADGSSIKQQANWKRHKTKALWQTSLIQKLLNSVEKLFVDAMQKALKGLFSNFSQYKVSDPVKLLYFLFVFEIFFTLYLKEIKTICSSS